MRDKRRTLYVYMKRDKEGLPPEGWKDLFIDLLLIISMKGCDEFYSI